jgi:hypothetical protein
MRKMKIWQPGPFGMKTLTPHGQVLYGILMVVFCTAFEYQGIFHPMSAADRPLAFIGWPCGIIGGLLTALGGWRQARKG